MARGRKPKNKIEEAPVIQEVIDKVFKTKEAHNKDIIIEEIKPAINSEWDVPLDANIPYFDSNLSYELSKYRPITETLGLDFNPDWFTETREVKLRTGKYCSYPSGSKVYNDFWKEQFDRCNNGYERNGYRITGDNYFFLNFYMLKGTEVEQAGAGRSYIFPEFFSKQYEYFHFIDICEKLGKDVGALKSRGVKSCSPLGQLKGNKFRKIGKD